MLEDAQPDTRGEPGAPSEDANPSDSNDEQPREEDGQSEEARE